MKDRNKYLGMIIIISYALLSSGCAKKEELKIGQTYKGGIIFYLDATGDHGLIAAPADQGVYTWGCVGSMDAYQTAVFYGSANTTTIAAYCPGTNAGTVCENLVIGEYSDWYLPDVDELNHMFVQRYEIGGFELGEYWASTAHSNPWNAYRQNFSSGSQSYGTRGSYHNVRAIRKF